MIYASCFNSNTIGTIEDTKEGYFLIKFPGIASYWVHEQSVNSIWNSEDDPQYDE